MAGARPPWDKGQVPLRQADCSIFLTYLGTSKTTTGSTSFYSLPTNRGDAGGKGAMSRETATNVLLPGWLPVDNECLRAAFPADANNQEME
jgi:hypothetical protein